MKVTTLGRKVTLKDSFLERVDARISKMERLFSEEAEAQVTVTVEKDWQTVEFTVRDKGLLLRSEKSAKGMEAAFDDAADTIITQVVRNRGKLNDKLRHGAAALLLEKFPDVREEGPFQVTREKSVFLPPISVEEAILQMNLVGHTFFLFRNAETGEVNVVYRRKAGDYGILIPE